MFCINVLEAGQVPLASAFFKHVEAADHKFGEIEFSDSPNGLPVLKDALGYFECKVTDTITIKKFPNLPKFGLRAGEVNREFLNAELFAEAFLKTCEPYRSRVGLLMFEFGRFYKTDFSVAEFSRALDTFFGKLPKDWPYGIEIRNRDFLGPEYFGVLAKHGVTHVYNSWTDMPSVSEQMAMAGSMTNPNLVAARFLMSPGRKYDESLKLFQPYDRVREADEQAREAVHIWPTAKKHFAELNRFGEVIGRGRLEIVLGLREVAVVGGAEIQGIRV